MAELVFVGSGLHDELDVSLRGIVELRSCDLVFAEFYTSKLNHFDKKRFEEQIGNSITILNREKTEDGSCILESAMKHKTGFIVVGDPMMATTHIDLRMRAIKQGISTRIIHNASIVTAAPGLLGLQNYKFGRTTTLVYPEGDYFPMSQYEAIRDNIKLGMHTLVLLDIQSDKEQYMTANDGIDLLLRMEDHYHENIITPESIACVVSQAGSSKPALFADIIKNLQQRDFGGPLHTLVIPGSLHFMEIEALEVCAGLPHEFALKLQKL